MLKFFSGGDVVRSQRETLLVTGQSPMCFRTAEGKRMRRSEKVTRGDALDWDAS